MNQSDFLRYRQIHLDFHTSEQIVGIGSEFDAEAWAQMLADAHVNSITCFARCHHGMIYYDSALNPERRHPHLTRNLLAEQIEAAHAHNIRVPIYTTIQWDYFTAQEHPEWVQVTPEGAIVGQKPYEAGFYARLCVNSPYVDFLKAHVTEMFETLPAVDGFFFDIVGDQDCSCAYCRREMLERGFDPSNGEERRKFGRQVINRFQRELSSHVRSYSAEATIFYNAGHIGPRHWEAQEEFSHWELESLPSGGWGYLHFPLAQRYARTLGNDCLGMTGKFHTSWGDFHSYKNEAALQFECFQMLALNAKCSIGDQLHPTGRNDQATYDLVGAVYAEVEKKEPWCIGARPVTDIGLFTPEEFTGQRLTPETLGAIRMLTEGGHQFDILDSRGDFDAYRVLILPDIAPFGPQLAAKVEQYIAKGGQVIASFEAGLKPDSSNFALPAWGVEKTGDGPTDENGQPVAGRNFAKGDYVDYLLAEGSLARGLRETEYVMYMRSLPIRAGEDAEVLASVVPAYFDRTWRHFCSHRQTPSTGDVAGPAVTRTGNVIYFAHPIFRQYNQNAPRWCKLMLLNALDLLLPDPLLRHQGPSSLVTAINAQDEQNRWIVHLLHYIPERRGLEFDVIEDVIPLHDLAVSLNVPGPVKSIRTAPEGVELKFVAVGGRVNFLLPRLNGHQMVEVSFA